MATARGVQAGRAYILIEAIDRTGRVLKGITNRLRAFSAEVTSLGRQMIFLGSAMAVPFVSAINSAKDFSDEMLALKAILGISDKQAASLEKRIRELGKSTSFTAGQVAAASTELARGGFSQTEIEDSIAGVLDFARAGRVDLATAATVMVRALRSFNMETNRAGEVADAFFIASKNGTTTVQELAQALSFSGGTADTLGFSLQQTLAIMSKMSNRMLFGTKAGTSLNQMFLRLVTESDRIRQSLGVDVLGALGPEGGDTLSLLMQVAGALRQLPPAERVAVVADIFNVRGARAALVVEAIEDIIQVTDQMARGAGQASAAAGRMDSEIGGSIRRIISAFDELKISVGAAFTAPFKALEDTLIPVINSLSEWAQQNQEMFVSAGRAVVAVIGLGVGFVALGAALKAAAFVFSLFTAGLGLLTSIPALAVVTSLVGAATAFTVAWDNIKMKVMGVIEVFQKEWKKTMEFFMKWWKPVQGAFTSAWKEWKGLTVDVLGDMLGFLEDIMPLFRGIAQIVGSALLAGLYAFASTLELIAITARTVRDLFVDVGALLSGKSIAVQDLESRRDELPDDLFKPRDRIKEQEELEKFQRNARKKAEEERAKAAEKGGGPITGGSITVPGGPITPSVPRPKVTSPIAEEKRRLAEEIKQSKIAIMLEDRQREIAAREEAARRARAIEDRRQEMLEIAKLDIKLLSEKDRARRNSLKEEIKERLTALKRAEEDERLAEEKSALRRIEDARERRKEMQRIHEMEKQLGRRVGPAVRGIDPRSPARPSISEAARPDKAKLNAMRRLELRRFNLENKKDSLLQSPTDTLGTALEKGSVEAAKQASQNKQEQQVVSLLTRIEQELIRVEHGIRETTRAIEDEAKV